MTMDHQHAIATHAAERYLLNELAGTDRDAFEAHYFSCAECAEDVRTGALMRDGVRAGLTAPATADARGTVVPIAGRRRWRPSVVAPWAMAASLALVAGYQAWWPMPRPTAIEATTPVLLRPASRGAVTTVTRPAAGVVAFALDLNLTEAASSLTYDLRTADGKSVASGVAATPPAGTPLLLVVPVAQLNAPGDYLLVMRDTSQAGRPVAEYRFAVTKP